MIIHLKKTVSKESAAVLAAENKAFHIVSEGNQCFNNRFKYEGSPFRINKSHRK